MRRFIQAANGKMLGSRPMPKKAPTAQHKETRHPTVRECASDDGGSGLSHLAAAWESNRTMPSTQVTPQRAIVSAPSLAAGRQLIGPEYSHVQATYTVYLEDNVVQERLLRAGYACSIPIAAKQNPKIHIPEEPDARAQEILAKIEERGIWKLVRHPEDPHATIITTPNVPNSDEGWNYLETGLRHAKGPRFIRPKSKVLLTGTTPPAPPPAPPKGYAPIKGVRSLLYSK